MMTEEKKRQIVKALSQRVSSIVCPICHQSKYSFIDGYTIDPVQDDYKAVQLGGKIIPSIMLVCNNCGHIDRFSLGVLGLMDKEAPTLKK
jgi:hypothetical protein